MTFLRPGITHFEVPGLTSCWHGLSRSRVSPLEKHSLKEETGGTRPTGHPFSGFNRRSAATGHLFTSRRPRETCFLRTGLWQDGPAPSSPVQPQSRGCQMLLRPEGRTSGLRRDCSPSRQEQTQWTNTREHPASCHPAVLETPLGAPCKECKSGGLGLKTGPSRHLLCGSWTPASTPAPGLHPPLTSSVVLWDAGTDVAEAPGA